MLLFRFSKGSLCKILKMLYILK